MLRLTWILRVKLAQLKKTIHKTFRHSSDVAIIRPKTTRLPENLILEGYKNLKNRQGWELGGRFTST